MKKAHTIFTRILALLLVICLLPVPAEVKAASVGDLTFELNSDGESYYVKSCATDATGSIEIPSTYNGKPVTAIGARAFELCTDLTGITIPDSVTSFGNWAFAGCYSLTNITIPDSVTSYGEYAFYEFPNIACNTYDNGMYLGNSNNHYLVLIKTTSLNITSCLVHPNTKFVSSEAFCYTDLTSVTIPDSVTRIGNSAFDTCIRLTNVTIGGGVTSIGRYAFDGCTSLTSVTYRGAQEQWKAIDIGEYNDELLKAEIRYHTHNYTIVVTKEPTKTETGIKTYTCSVCGDSYTEVLPALFYGTNIDMGNSLDMNFYFYKGVIETLEPEHVVEFVRTFADGSTETTYVPLSRFPLNGDYYQIVYPGLSAAEMNDTVSVTVCHKNERISETKTDSMCSYVRRALDQITDPVSRRMYVDMLSYGAAAQINFGYGTEHLATDILTEDEKAEGTQSLAAITNGYTRSNTNYYGTNFDLENEIKLNLYVLASAMGENGYAEITYTNFKGEQITKTVTEYTANGDYYMFTPDFVVGADGRCLLNIQFCKADGTKVVTVTDSMESYVARAVEKDPEKYGWMQKMMIYSDSARAYLNK